jgi:hypothetical protein
MIQEWVDECDTQHVACFRPKTILPSRVIDVSLALHGSDVKLYESTSAAHSAQYIALSYCWGDMDEHGQYTTTKSNLNDNKQTIRFSTLPKTIQDAVTVTRRLGIRYLWVDALCIVQDDFNDKHAEMETMGDIYANAYLTIFAASAAGCGEGFLQSRPNPHFEVPFRHDHKRVQKVLFSELWGRGFVPLEEPLNQRAWSLQENLLSARVLFYGSSQPHWRCKCISFKSGGEVTQNEDTKWAHHLVLPWKAGTKGLTISSGPTQTTIYPSGLLGNWHHVVEEYSHRLLKFEDDRLHALSGIAAKYRDQSKANYLAGLWESTLEFDLLWESQFSHWR